MGSTEIVNQQRHQIGADPGALPKIVVAVAVRRAGGPGDVDELQRGMRPQKVCRTYRQILGPQLADPLAAKQTVDENQGPVGRRNIDCGPGWNPKQAIRQRNAEFLMADVSADNNDIADAQFPADLFIGFIF